MTSLTTIERYGDEHECPACQGTGDSGTEVLRRVVLGYYEPVCGRCYGRGHCAVRCFDCAADEPIAGVALYCADLHVRCAVCALHWRAGTVARAQELAEYVCGQAVAEVARLRSRLAYGESAA